MYYQIIVVAILSIACREKNHVAEPTGAQKSKLVLSGQQSNFGPEPETVVNECRDLRAKKEQLTIAERRKQVDLLVAACRQKPDQILQTLRELSDTDDVEVTTQVLRKMMEQIGQEAVVAQMLELKDVMENKASNRLMVAVIDALVAVSDLSPQTIGLLKKFAGNTGQAGALASLIRMRGHAFGVDKAMREFELMELKGKARDETLLGISSLLLESDPTRSLELAASASQADSSGVLQQLFEKWFEKDQSAAATGFGSLTWEQIASCCKNPLVVNKIIESGGEESLRAALVKMPMTETGLAESGPLLNVLAKRDLSKTMDFIREMPLSASTHGLVEQMFKNVADQNAELAMQQAFTLPDDLKSSAIIGAVKSLAVKDFEGAIQYADAADSSSKALYYREIGRAVACAEPGNAVAMLENPQIRELIGNEFSSEMLDHTVRGWAKSDLVEARTWVEKLPATDLPMGVQGLMNPWMKSDPVAASEWLSALPPGAARDAGARVVIEQVKNTDPEMAEQWRKSLSQPTGGRK